MRNTGEDVICIFNDGEVDGFAAAWALWKHYPNAHFAPMSQAGPHIDTANCDVYILGGSPSMSLIYNLGQMANNIYVVDHHEAFRNSMSQYAGKYPDNLHIVFNPQFSSAGLTWDFLNFHNPRPAVLNYIEDFTLGRYQYPETRPVAMAVQSYPPDFMTWDRLIYQTDPNALVQEGEILLRNHQRNIDSAISRTQRRANIAGYDVPVVNLAPEIVQDACFQLSHGEPFVVAYWDTPMGRQFNLFSGPQGVDVSGLAFQYGGVGGAHQANFMVPREHPMSQL